MSASPGIETTTGAEAGGRRLALVVAVTDYTDPSLRRLRAPAGDAADLRDLLAEPEIGGFSVTSVINEKAQQIRLAIEDFLADRHRDDLLLIYLSCHGLMDARRRLYFAARDTIKNRLASSGVESQWLLDQLEDCRARRQIVILDCCFSGAFARGAKGEADIGIGERLVGEGRGRVVLTASRSSEYSFEGEPLEGEDAPRGSVFTSALIEGIRTGRADADGDGTITVEDAYTYAFERVRSIGARQTPQRWLYGAEGSIVLARARPAEATAPAPAAAPPTGRDAPPSGAAHGRTPRPAVPRAVLAGALAVVALAGGVLAAVLLIPDGTDPDSSPDGGSSADGAFSGTFSAKQPWHLLIDDAAGDPGGCDVTLTQEDTNWQRRWPDFYGRATFQIPRSGRFRYDTNHRDCLVLPQHYVDDTDLPFPLRYDDGDSPLFESPGFVTVSVTDWTGSSTCELRLLSAEDGNPLDSREAVEGEGPVRLASNGPARVYILDPICSIRVEEATD